MSKWKCGICNSEFENYHAQGFDSIIYCPLCYYKELYKRDKQEIERLNNKIKEQNLLLIEFQDMEQKVEQLENIRKEAVEYIKEDMYREPNELYGLVDGEHLLNILNKGSDKE